MKITIVNNDHTTLEPVFDPIHREAVVKFYNELMNSGQIKMFRVWN